MGRRRRQQRRNLWTSLLPRRFLLMMRRGPSMTLERILLIQKEVAATIPLTEEDSTSQVAIRSVAVLSSSSFISTDDDLEAFTQIALILQFLVNDDSYSLS